MDFCIITRIITTLVIFQVCKQPDGTKGLRLGDNFQYIGRIQNSVSEPASHYFASYNAAGWYQAKQDCEGLQNSSNLVRIETASELTEIKEYLAQHGNTGTKYWTGGVYNMACNKITWDIGGPPLDYCPPWDEGFPNKTSVENNKIAVNFRPYVKFQNYEPASLLRYICEYKNVY